METQHIPSSLRLLHHRTRSSDSNAEESGGGGPPLGGLLAIFFIVFVVAACFGRGSQSCGSSRRRELQRRGDAEIDEEEHDDPSRMMQVAYSQSLQRQDPEKSNHLKIDFKQLLEATTMQVQEADLVQREQVQNLMQTLAGALASLSSPTSAAETAAETIQDEEMDGNSKKENNNEEKATECSQKMLQLPSDSPNGQRLVPSSCTICLSAFHAGETVSWSSSRNCSHAFHTTCIVQYANSFLERKLEQAEGNDPSEDSAVPCPLCRSSFVCYQYENN